MPLSVIISNGNIKAKGSQSLSQNGGLIRSALIAIVRNSYQMDGDSDTSIQNAKF